VVGYLKLIGRVSQIGYYGLGLCVLALGRVSMAFKSSNKSSDFMHVTFSWEDYAYSMD